MPTLIVGRYSKILIWLDFERRHNAMQSRVQIKTDVGCYYVKEEHVNYYIAYAGDYYEHKITTECTEIIEKTDVKEIQTE